MGRLDYKPDLSGYQRVDMAAQQAAPHNPPPASTEAPGYNAALVCPLPQVSAAPDGLRQFYRGGMPQYRLVPPGQLQTGAPVASTKNIGAVQPDGTTIAVDNNGKISATTPGPFANDTAAAKAGVAVGKPYYQSSGAVVVRLV